MARSWKTLATSSRDMTSSPSTLWRWHPRDCQRPIYRRRVPCWRSLSPPGREVFQHSYHAYGFAESPYRSPRDMLLTLY